eukprot:11953488-Heterocapsa_arctica.AAC.1
MDREEEINECFMRDNSDGDNATMDETINAWERQIGVPAIVKEQMERSAATRMKTAMFIIDFESGVGMWRICENVNCYRCNIIEGRRII